MSEVPIYTKRTGNEWERISYTKQNKVKIEAVKYGQCLKTSGCNLFFEFYKNLIDRVPLLLVNIFNELAWWLATCAR